MCLLFSCIVSTHLHADVELNGLLLNQTRTFAGQAFYVAFVDNWQVLDSQGQYNLVIVERPSARSGSQISVKYGEQIIYQQVLHFNAQKAQRAGQAAASVVFERVMNEQVEQVLSTNPDMAQDEIKLN
ncbi:CsgE family curli-type amyloid fiber assembly protein [Agitococcus lubricus]|uniref:Curli production assembly/transport component CsgE n=1 Tax=Agitococcus lubricus TaxID=1077255 RepID=A0A2T5IU27_9GAMM|nr:CsgE family curli-type amyloid fiber assembly protein [Agitococcus lubricus]PTQ87379.1 curli production assembly/transport component CsgE [Agitococcus lubricus]